MKKENIITVVSILFILLFTYAAVSKLLDFTNFKFQIGQSPFITPFSHFLPWVLPIGELLLVVLLALEKTQKTALYISLFVMCLFTSYIYFMMHYSYYTPCSCGGILASMGWRSHFVFNLVFVVLAISAILIQSRSQTLKTNN